VTAEAEIRKTLGLYAQRADNCDSDGYALLFAEDGVLLSSAGVFTGRPAIKKFLEDLYGGQPEGRRFKHCFSNWVIDVNGDNTADVRGDMVVLECLNESPWQVRTVVRHLDRLIKQADGTWLFKRKHMQGARFTRLIYTPPVEV
jgi:ketosteroid isomerase-like protein